MGLVKNNTGLEEIKESVANVENTSTEIKTNVNEVKTNTEGIVLSNESIKAIVDEIQNRIGLTGDTGGSASAGSVMSKLNQIIGSAGSGGGITGFKYTSKSDSFTYKTTSSGIVIGKVRGGYDSTTPSLTINNGGFIRIKDPSELNYDVSYTYIGFFTNNATIKGNLDNDRDTVTAYIFEFI